MKTKTNVKAGGISINHNQASAAIKVRSNVKASGPILNHNQASALRVKANLKAGGPPLVIQHNQTTGKKVRRAKSK